MLTANDELATVAPPAAPHHQPPTPPDFQWIVSQIGSRELYGCPLSFHRRGHLKLFYTDLWCPHLRSIFARMPSPWFGLARRFHPELPREKVVSFTPGMLADEFAHKLRRPPATTEAAFLRYIDVGKNFGRRVARHLARQRLNPARDALFAFSTGALEVLQLARERGLLAAVDQLDPARTDQDMIRQEVERWPEWESLPGTVPDAYFDRLAQEWQASDLVFVNSEFSRRAIHQQGVPLEKIAVVPLAYEPEAPVAIKTVSPPDQPLQVLWLGQIVLRKGIPYLFEAARQLQSENIRFTVAGRIGISETALRTAPPNLQVLGKVNREEAIRLYRTSDVFVLPTISDGFAITQLEAMSYGLPVITTPNCGDVVAPGRDGYILPIRDPAALAATLATLCHDRSLLQCLAEQAQLKSRQFTLERYASTIERAAAAFLNQDAAEVPPQRPAIANRGPLGTFRRSTAYRPLHQPPA
ncbi:MAG TPA: glycosyltransferase family 4 protein [Phycisphaerae bacterium]|nr:glycosyltransferase family 4 protein [Phycisphaerae bacterium]